MPRNVSLHDDLAVTENRDFIGSVFGMPLPRRRPIKGILRCLELEDARSRRVRVLKELGLANRCRSVELEHGR